MQKNFLLGKGELLTSSITRRKGFDGEKLYPYTVAEAITRLGGKFTTVSSVIDRLPSEACPGDRAVALLTLNPAFIARSFFPEELLSGLNLISVGSRNVIITPQKWTKNKEPRECDTTQLFVAGKRSVFRSIVQTISAMEPTSLIAKDFSKIEDVASNNPIRFKPENIGSVVTYEVGIHLLPRESTDFENEDIQLGFYAYSRKCGVEVLEEYQIRTGSLWFVPIVGSLDAIRDLSKYSFIRVVRPMPKLRDISPVVKATASERIPLPEVTALSDEPKVAILDGGLPDEHSINPWLERYYPGFPK